MNILGVVLNHSAERDDGMGYYLLRAIEPARAAGLSLREGLQLLEFPRRTTHGVVLDDPRAAWHRQSMQQEPVVGEPLEGVVVGVRRGHLALCSVRP